MMAAMFQITAMKNDYSDFTRWQRLPTGDRFGLYGMLATQRHFPD